MASPVVPSVPPRSPASPTLEEPSPASSSLRRRASVSALDVPRPELAPETQLSPAWHPLLARLELADQRLSSHLHALPAGLLLESLVLLPALAFSSYAMPFMIAVTAFLAPPLFAATAVLACLATLGVTTLLKRATRRLRPGLHACAHRRYAVRSMETNNAMPSGDSAQAALWCTLFASACWPGAPCAGAAVLAVVPVVQAARVFFGCHWAADTCVGAAIGAGIGHAALAAAAAVSASLDAAA
jgi:hypothetical protein